MNTNFLVLQLAYHVLEYKRQPSGYDLRYITRTKQALKTNKK